MISVALVRQVPDGVPKFCHTDIPVCFAVYGPFGKFDMRCVQKTEITESAIRYVKEVRTDSKYFTEGEES